MEVIYQARQTGRTTKLIEMCAAAEKRREVSYIICSTHQQAHQIAKRAKELDLFIAFPLTTEEFMRKDYYRPNISNFFIDNADYLLQSLTSVHIAAISLERKEEDVVS